VTNRNNGVAVITGPKTALFSPDDVAAFLAALPAETPHPAPLSTVTPRRRLGPIPTIAGVAIGVAVIGLGIAANVYSPGPPSYTLTSSALTIHDRFYPVTLRPGQVDLPEVRVIDLNSDSDWRPTDRTNGFANSHYESGWFRVANGQKVRLYRTGGNRMVLLPPNAGGSAVLYQAANPDQFVADLRNSWSARNGGK
jgi:hypothetical protein